MNFIQRFLQKIRLRAQQKSLALRASQQKIERRRLDTDAAKTVGILFDATQAAHQEQVLHFAEQLIKKGKKVRLLGYIHAPTPKKVEGAKLNFPHFYKNEMSSSGTLKSTVAEDFIQQKFDVLFGLYPNSQFALDYVGAASLAYSKIGPHCEQFPDGYDLMIDAGQNADLQHFIKQLNFYTHQLQSRRAQKYEATI